MRQRLAPHQPNEDAQKRDHEIQIPFAEEAPVRTPASALARVVQIAKRLNVVGIERQPRMC